ncbi:MAG: bifunctional riboflavin kinase/FAD synthetase [Candidatus Saganbacteria bacterium]|nr:bifunctional riboflavin kinase/FAD synthetase [Candidatus Saganbacteria bacterium]
MKIIKTLRKLKLKNPVVVLGTFDGVHLGHVKILKDAVKFAKTKGLPAIAITFDPHPQEVVAPERGLRLITTIEERAPLMAGLGLDALVVIKFDHGLRNLSSEDFVNKYLVKKLNARYIFVGFDYAFGSKRAGGIGELKKFSKKYGFNVKVIRAVKIGRQIVKSSAIRELISLGRFTEAIRLLGHPYPIHGRVVKGSGRGRGLGFPTANILPSYQKLLPAHGVYAGYVRFGKQRKKCAVNIGARPTFIKDGVAVEVHIPNFRGDLLGKDLKVELGRRLRAEIQFSDVEELKKQIRKDISKIKRMKF